MVAKTTPPARSSATSRPRRRRSARSPPTRSATQDFLGRGYRRERVALTSRATAVPRLAKPARRNGHAPFERPRDSHVIRLAFGSVLGGCETGRVRLPFWLRQALQ